MKNLKTQVCRHCGEPVESVQLEIEYIRWVHITVLASLGCGKLAEPKTKRDYINEFFNEVQGQKKSANRGQKGGY